MRLFILIIMMMFSSVGCGPNGSIEGGSALTGSKEKGDDGRAAPGGGKTGAPLGETSFDLTKCGYPITNPSAVIASQQLAMEPSSITISVPGPLGIFQTKKTVTINGTFVMETSLARQTISYNSVGTPVVDAPAVTAALASSSGSGDATILDFDDRAKIGTTNPEWAGIFCTLQPATRIERNSDLHVATEFSQPIPFGLIAVGDVVRLKSELASKRTWTNVVAKIAESTNPSIPAGSALTGNVVAEPVKVDGGDIAVKISYNFGGADKNQMIGLPSSIVWYVDTTNHKVKWIQVDTTGSAPVAFK